MMETTYTQLADTFIRLCSQLMMGEVGRLLLTLSRGEYGVLLFLADQKEGVTSTMISEELGIGPGGVANVLKMLEKKGLVDKQQDTRDKRANCVTITPKGRALLDDRYAQIRQSTAELMEAMGADESEALNGGLEKLWEVAQAAERAREDDA